MEPERASAAISDNPTAVIRFEVADPIVTPRESARAVVEPSVMVSEVLSTGIPLKPKGIASIGTSPSSSSLFMRTLILCDVFGYLPRAMSRRSSGSSWSKSK